MDVDMKHAQAEFEKFCKALDADGWRYNKNEEKLTIETGATGDDLPINIYIQVDANRELLYLLSKLPINVPEDKRIDMVVAVCMVNDLMVHGCFDYNIQEGTLFFRMANSYKDSSLGDDLYKYMLYCSCQTIDEYNDKLLMLSSGIIDLEAFIKLMDEE